MEQKTNVTEKYIQLHGDEDQVRRDVSELKILAKRHGPSFILDVLSEFAGDVAERFKFDKDERKNTIENLLTQLKDSLEERL